MLNRNSSPPIIGNILIKQCVGSSFLHPERYVFPHAGHIGCLFLILGKLSATLKLWITRLWTKGFKYRLHCTADCLCSFTAVAFWDVVGEKKNDTRQTQTYLTL